MKAEDIVPSIACLLEIRFTWSRHAFQTKSKAGIATLSFEIELVRQRLKYLRSEVNNAEKKTFEQEPSSVNVFADLGLPDAAEHLIKAGLVVRIERILRELKLTQTAAAGLVGINQPKVSTMLAGQFRGYSVERLMRFHVAVGQDVEIVVKPKKRRIAELRVAAFFPANQCPLRWPRFIQKGTCGFPVAVGELDLPPKLRQTA